MKKQFLLAAVLTMVFPFASSAFADGTLEISSYKSSINSLDSFIVVGTITGGSIHNPVELKVLDPNGDLLYKPMVSFGGDGQFSKLFHPPLQGFEPGVYTVIASQKEVSMTPELKITVLGSPSANIISTPQGPITIQADAVQGSSVINISGVTQSREGDVTIKVTAPNGNLVSIDQVTPSSRGQFSIEIITGGPLWVQDGQYTVTAFQGSGSELSHSVQVEIEDGVVVPEFGTLAIVILSVSIMSIVLLRFRAGRLFPIGN